MRKTGYYFIAVIFLFIKINSLDACSMYKLTLHGKTYVGCNEDAWRTTPRLWFESKNENTKYGAAFTGSRYDGANGFAPQSGMNEVGLSFSRLASYTPRRKAQAHRKSILNPTKFLKQVLHSCRTVEEVNALMSQYDRTIFLEDVFIYIDKSGKYLVVEPYSTQLGQKPTYVLSNFCPSITSPKDALKLQRYRKGLEVLKIQQDTSLRFLQSLSDSMHVCRTKIGDGTLLTSIWNLNEGKFHLFFYHDYSHCQTFDLKEELRKGDHIKSIQKLFPENLEFEKLGRYITTKNSRWLMWTLSFLSIFFFCSSTYFIFRVLFKKHEQKYMSLLLSFLGFSIAFYAFLLCTHQAIFYFEAPYVDKFSRWVSLTAYLPNILACLILPLIYLNYGVFKAKSWNLFPRNLFLLNNVMYMILLCFFFYWELFWF